MNPMLKFKNIIEETHVGKGKFPPIFIAKPYFKEVCSRCAHQNFLLDIPSRNFLFGIFSDQILRTGLI
jgi:hypothetical protein